MGKKKIQVIDDFQPDEEPKKKSKKLGRKDPSAKAVAGAGKKHGRLADMAAVVHKEAKEGKKKADEAKPAPKSPSPKDKEAKDKKTKAEQEQPVDLTTQEEDNEKKAMPDKPSDVSYQATDQEPQNKPEEPASDPGNNT